MEADQTTVRRRRQSSSAFFCLILKYDSELFSLERNNLIINFFPSHSFGANSPISTINSIIKSVTRRLTDKNQLEILKKFTDKDLKEGRTMKQAIETGEANIAWLNKNQEKIFKWLRENLD